MQDKKTKLLIFPLGGNAIEALDCLGNSFELLGFIDDNQSLQSSDYQDFPIFSRDILKEKTEAKILAVVGSPQNFRKREQIINSLRISKERFVKNIIHPSAQISKYAKIGYNALFMANVVITAEAEIGNHCIILPNTTIHHETKIEDFTWIGSGVSIAGGVKVEKNCWIGSGSNLMNNIQIGEKTLVGLGSNVLKSFSSNLKIAGNPAQVIATFKE